MDKEEYFKALDNLIKSLTVDKSVIQKHNPKIIYGTIGQEDYNNEKYESLFVDHDTRIIQREPYEEELSKIKELTSKLKEIRLLNNSDSENNN